jgi:hypothetical protein
MSDESQNQRAPMTMFWLVKTTPAWLAKPPHGPDGRFEFIGKVLQPILARHPGAALRYFDAEAYSAWCSDVMAWTVHDAAAYDALVEDLRETAFWDTYFQVLHIVPARENQYAAHYGVAAPSAAAA